MTNPFKIIIIVLIVVVIGAVISLATGAWDPSWNPFSPKSPEAVMGKMFRTMSNVETVASQGETYFEADLFQEKVRMDFIFDIIADETDSKEPKAAAKMDLIFFSPEGDFYVGFELKMIGEAFYFQVTEIPDIPPDILAEIKEADIDLDQYLNQWIKVDEDSIKSFYELVGLSQAEIDRMMREYEEQQEIQTELAEKLMELITKRASDLLEIKEVMPDAEIGGVRVYHYVVLLDKEGVKKIFPEIIEEIFFEYVEEDFIEELKMEWKESKEEILEQMNQALDMIFMVVGDISADFWIGKDDYYLYKIKFDKTIDIGWLMSPGSKMELTFGFDINYSDFNQPVTIETPLDYKTIEELLLPLLKEIEIMNELYQEEMMMPPIFQLQAPEYQAGGITSPLLQNLPQLFQASLLNIPF